MVVEGRGELAVCTALGCASGQRWVWSPDYLPGSGLRPIFADEQNELQKLADLSSDW